MAFKQEYVFELDVAHLSSKNVAWLLAEGIGDPLQLLVWFGDLPLAIVQTQPLTFMQSF